MLGLGVRGIGWRDIEIERLPTGQPAVRLHGRAAARAEQLGMGRIAVSISHESDYAVAIAFGIRTAGGAFLFPPDIEERLDDRERRILARIERLRDSPRPVARRPWPRDAPPGRAAREATAWLSGRRSASAARARLDATPIERRGGAAGGAVRLDDDIAGALLPGTAGARPQGLVRQAARHRRLARLRGGGAAGLPRRRPRPGPGS